MKGKLLQVDKGWVIEYPDWKYSSGKKGVLGGYSKTIVNKQIPLHPLDISNVELEDSLIIVGSEVSFKKVLINPMGREVDHLDLTQNQSGCVWVGKLFSEIKNKPREIKFEDVFNDEKRQGVKEFISKYPKSITKEELIDRYIDETGYGMDMWSKTENETFTTIIKILYDRKN